MKFRELELVRLKLDIASPGVKPSIIGVAVDIQDDKKEVLVEFSDDEENKAVYVIGYYYSTNLLNLINEKTVISGNE